MSEHNQSIGSTSDEEIAERAYRLFEERGGEEHGHDEEDWLRAEAELRTQANSKADAKPGEPDSSANDPNDGKPNPMLTDVGESIPRQTPAPNV